MATQKRFLALDVMRGLTLALMILVNTPGSWSYVYAPLEHSAWNGATPTDFIFPFFLFIVGSAMFFSNRSQAALSKSQRTGKILRRTVLLFLIGLFINAFMLFFNGGWEHLRFLGVLQRIALAYGAAAFIMWLPGLYRLIISAAILLGYWALLNISSDPYTMSGNIVLQVDTWLMGANHLWQGDGMAFDPEGLVSTIPAIVNVIIGFEATRILIGSENKIRAQWQLAGYALAMIVAALLWNNVFPINKALWTSPFVLLTCGMAIVVLLLLVQLEKLAALKPVYRGFTMLGKNPLFIYILSMLWVEVYELVAVGDVTLYHYLFSQLTTVFAPYPASLIFALLHVAALWLMAWWLERKNIVIAL